MGQTVRPTGLLCCAWFVSQEENKGIPFRGHYTVGCAGPGKRQTANTSRMGGQEAGQPWAPTDPSVGYSPWPQNGAKLRGLRFAPSVPQVSSQVCGERNPLTIYA